MLNGIFTNPGFGAEALTESYLQIPFMPTIARALGVVNWEGIPTTTVDLELDSVTMTIIPAKPRGGPAYNYSRPQRGMRNFVVPHFPMQDTIKPEAIQNVRKFGTPTRGGSIELQTVMDVTQRRLTSLALSHDATLEHIVLGALTGTIYDWDGVTVIANLFSEFGIEQSVFDFELNNDSIDLKHLIFQILRTVLVALGSAQQYGYVHCLCGNDFFDAFIQHPQVEAAFKYYQATKGAGTWSPDSKGQIGDFLRADNRTGFWFCGIYFQNYIGSVAGENNQYVNFVAPSEAHFFPVGVPGLFPGVFAPADMIEAVNTEGLPRYARAEPLDYGKGIGLYTESNPFAFCSRPACLVKGITSGLPAGIGNDYIPGS